MANTLDQRILELIKKYMEKLTQKKVLTSMEEVEANTNETNLVAAPVVAELNNNLGNCRFEQEGEDFFIVGADSVRKKLGSKATLHTRAVQISNSNTFISTAGLPCVIFVTSQQSYSISGYATPQQGQSFSHCSISSITDRGFYIRHTYDNASAYTVTIGWVIVD